MWVWALIFMFLYVAWCTGVVLMRGLIGAVVLIGWVWAAVAAALMSWYGTRHERRARSTGRGGDLDHR